jgi:pimeloyl-ACP methyl ester carboxylesterase
VDSSSIHVVEAGDPAGQPVVFLHGWPESWRSWQFFYNGITADPAMITATARAAYVAAYSTAAALTAGFNWYRSFPRDAEENRRTGLEPMTTPLLYLRGEHESGDISTYVAGFLKAGATHVNHAAVAGAPKKSHRKETWQLIADFVKP